MKKVASLLVYSILLALIAASIAYGRANNTTTTVSSGNNPSCSAQSVTFTATVSKTGGPGTPTGTVTFKNGGSTMGSGTLSGSGGPATATFSTSSLTVGGHSITAVYGGDGNFNGSTSPAITQNVDASSPSISGQPGNLVVCSGSSASFSVTATGTDLSYQWRKNGVNLSNGGTISGSTTATLTINTASAADSGSYDVVVTTGCGSPTSNPASLTVNITPSITVQPTAQAACLGQTATYTLTATGSALTFQWRKNGVVITDGATGNGSTYGGTTTSTLQIIGVAAADVATSANGFDGVVSGTCAPSATSSRVALTVNSPPAITGQPTSQTVCSGSTSSFSVTATGAGLAFQWRKNGVNLTNGATGNGSTYSGATSATLQITGTAAGDAALAATGFDCVVTGSCSPSATSNRVALTVNIVPSISGQPVAQTVCVGVTASFSVTAAGTGLTYQWRKNGVTISDGATGNGSTYSGTTSSTLQITNTASADAATAATGFDCVVTGTCAPSVTSSRGALTVNSAPAITGQPTSQTVCSGSTSSFSVTATGAGLAFQWRKNGVNLTNGATGNGSTYSGATSATLQITGTAAGDAALAATGFDCVVTGSCSPSATSNRVALTVNIVPSISGQPVAQTVCVGVTASFSVTAAGTGLTYQWRKNGVTISDGATGNGSTYSGTTSSTLQITNTASADAATAATGFDCVVTGTCAPSVTSSRVALTVNSAPAITGQPTSQTVCSGSTSSFSVTATGAGLTYQWRKNGVDLSNGATGNGSTYSGATAATLQITGTAAGDTAVASTGFDCVVTGSCSPSATSNRVALTVNIAPSINGQPVAQTVCVGVTASFSVTAGGSGLTYRWRKNGTNLSNGNTGNGSTYSGATSSTLQITNTASADAATAATGFDCVVTGTCSPSATSSRVALTVNPAPAITGQPSAQTVCATTTASYTVAATGPGLSYQWRKNGAVISDGATGNGSTYSGTTTTNLQVSNVASADAATAATGYDCVVSGSCTPAATSSRVALTVNTAPSVTAQPTDQSGCIGSTVSFSLTASGGGLTYQWRKNGVNLVNGATGNGSTYSGVTSATLQISGLAAGDATAATTGFDCLVAGTCNPSPPPTLPGGPSAIPKPDATITTASPVCASSTGNTASVPNAGVGAAYSWSLSAGSITAGQGTPSITYTAPTNGNSFTVNVTVTNSTGCGQNGSSSVANSTGGLTIQGWNNPAAGGILCQTSTLQPPGAAYPEGGTVPYRFTMTQPCAGSAWSITIQYDFQDVSSGAHIFDFLTTYNTSELNVSGHECDGGSCSGSANTFSIPADGSLTYQIAGVFTVLNGSVTGGSGYRTASTGSSVTKSLTISGTSTGGDVIVLFGGHLARDNEWGSGGGAADLSGGTYTMGLVNYSGGSLSDHVNIKPTTVSDNQVQADLSVTNSDSPDPICSGNSLSYAIGASNAGPSTEIGRASCRER